MDRYKWINRLLIIHTPSLNNQNYIDAMNEYIKYKHRFDKRKVKIFYKLKNEFKIYLYGLDGSLKHIYNKINVNKIIDDIGKMPMALYD